MRPFVLHGAALLALTISLAGCTGAIDAKPEPADEPESIGIATMEADGTIVLRLRAELPEGGGAGEGYFRYPPSDPQYREILDHLGGLEPGQSKPVPPWPEG